MVLTAKFSSLILAALVGLTMSHPTPHARSDAEVARHEQFQTSAKRSLAGCQNSMRKRGLSGDGSALRRRNFLENVRKSRGIQPNAPYVGKRDLDSLNRSHASNLTGISNSTDPSQFLTNHSCILGPEVTEGPYFVAGEYVRFDLREEQEGVDLWLDVELIDVNTCEPVSDIFIDFWHANSTGVYAGVVASGNGDTTDESNLDATWLRGFQQTNSTGVAQFLTIFPGHYTGRTNHIHITAASPNGTQFDNGTYAFDTVSHVGQLFFDQDLITEVEAVAPYNTNTQELTTNDVDMILLEEADAIDPFIEYVLVGDSIEQGIFGWASVGIDTTAAHTISAASTLTEDGGVANPNTGGPGGDAPGGAPSGEAPSGVPPSGSDSLPAPSATA